MACLVRVQCKSCGSGIQTRTRNCTELPDGTEVCNGETYEERRCQLIHCPGEHDYKMIKVYISNYAHTTRKISISLFLSVSIC